MAKNKFKVGELVIFIRCVDEYSLFEYEGKTAKIVHNFCDKSYDYLVEFFVDKERYLVHQAEIVKLTSVTRVLYGL